MKGSHTNRLAKEKSPYLLQHQHNPVDWREWNEASLAQARAENRPILLSIGYAAWSFCDFQISSPFFLFRQTTPAPFVPPAQA